MKQKFDDELQNIPQAAPGVSATMPMEGGVNEESVLSSPFATLETGLKRIFGDNFDINNIVAQEALIEHISMNKEQNEKLAAALQRDPRLAQMMMDIIAGKRNAHSALARYFGSSMGRVNEGTPEYEEVMQADDERREELMRAVNDRREYEKNLADSRSVIEQFCKERGYDPADFMNRVWEGIVMPILSGNYSLGVCTALDNALNYEQDMEQAFVAGDIKGRNTNIQRLREEFGDGMPKGMSSVAPQTGGKRRVNSLIEDALNA